jgi:hypothetical protein
MPIGAEISLDDNASADNWYFDPDISDDGEFTTNVDAYAARTPTYMGVDFYTVILHELGHALGLSSTAGVFFKINQFVMDIGDDPNSTDPATRLFAFNVNGGAAEATFTNEGDRHFYEGPNAPPGAPVHPNDLLNDGRAFTANTTERRLISDLDVLVLGSAFGYDISLPSNYDNMMVTYNATTDVLQINTAGNVDTVVLEESSVFPSSFPSPRSQPSRSTPGRVPTRFRSITTATSRPRSPATKVLIRSSWSMLRMQTLAPRSSTPRRSARLPTIRSIHWKCREPTAPIASKSKLLSSRSTSMEGSSTTCW